MKIESKTKTVRRKSMMRLLGSLMVCIALQGSAYADNFETKGNAVEASKEVNNLKLANYTVGKDYHHSKGNHIKCYPGPKGPTGIAGAPGNPGPDFDQYACLYSNVAQTLTTGQNVLFANQISISGITYDETTGLFTLEPGTYSVTYFSEPVANLYLVANGSIVPNAPLGGCSTILTLANSTNTLALQALGSASLSAPDASQCNAMITIYQID